jgi:hypothetical protein
VDGADIVLLSSLSFFNCEIFLSLSLGSVLCSSLIIPGGLLSEEEFFYSNFNLSSLALARAPPNDILGASTLASPSLGCSKALFSDSFFSRFSSLAFAKAPPRDSFLGGSDSADFTSNFFLSASA